MEDDDDKEDLELVIDGKSQANQDAMQQDTELENRDAHDLCRGVVADRAGVVMVTVPVRLDVRVRLGILAAFALDRVLALDVVALFAVDRAVGALLLRDGGLGLAIGLGAVGSVRRQPVTVRVVNDAHPGEHGGAPAEGYELDDEDEEYADETDRHRVGL